MENIEIYLNRCTLILGDVKSGKTARTQKILEAFIDAGYAEKIAVIDMAPDRVRGIGGKMIPPAGAPILYLTTSIAAPRLTGVDEEDAGFLAGQNARALETLFDALHNQPKEILFVNDASLYLQAGDLEPFLAILATASTQVINAYQGKTFADSTLTQREGRLVESLLKTCDTILRLS